jgi:hypothetical protein
MTVGSGGWFVLHGVAVWDEILDEMGYDVSDGGAVEKYDRAMSDNNWSTPLNAAIIYTSAVSSYIRKKTSWTNLSMEGKIRLFERMTKLFFDKTGLDHQEMENEAINSAAMAMSGATG